MRATSIDIVSHEEIIGLWDLSSDLEELQQILELAMDVSTNNDWSTNRNNIGFILEYLFCLSRGGILPSHRGNGLQPKGEACKA